MLSTLLGEPSTASPQSRQRYSATSVELQSLPAMVSSVTILSALHPSSLHPSSFTFACSGLLNINKPAGITSRDAVDLVQRLARPAKVGHAGTLDPLATGVLVICVGSATRLIEYVQRMPKRYVGTFLLGRSSATEDIDGAVTLLPDPPIPAAAQIEAAAEKLVGSHLQRPPAFSAPEGCRPTGLRSGPARRGGGTEAAADRGLLARRSCVTTIPNWSWRSSAAAGPTFAPWAATWPNRSARPP